MAAIPNFSEVGAGIQSVGAGVGAFGAAAGDLFASKGASEAAASYGEAARAAQQEANIAGYTGLVQKSMAARQLYQTNSTASADTGANGLRMGGSAAAIVRSNTAQGALTQGLIGAQTQVNVIGYEAQAQSDLAQQQQAENLAASSKSSGLFSSIGGAISSIAGIGEIAAAF